MWGGGVFITFSDNSSNISVVTEDIYIKFGGILYHWRLKLLMINTLHFVIAIIYNLNLLM